MKKLLTLSLSTLLLCSNAMASQAINGIAAVVNQKVITRTQVSEQTSLLKKRLRTQHIALPSNTVLRKQVLDHLINVELQLQLAKNNNMTVSDAELNDALANIAARNHASITALKKRITATGESFTHYKADIKKQMVLSKIQHAALGNTVQVNDNEVNAIYKKQMLNQQLATVSYHVKDILVGLPDAPTSQQVHAAKLQAQSVYQQLKNGKDFSATAVATSSDATALTGGDLGWRNLEGLPTVFANRVASMKTGEISSPIHTSNGFHIIKLVAKKSAKTPDIRLTHVRHILLKIDAKHSPAQVKAQLLAIRRQIKNGKSFAAMAKQYSVDTGSKAQGGDIGWTHRGELVAQFQAAMDKLKPGQISQPVQTEFGFHLIEVLGRRNVKENSQVVKEQIKQRLFQKQYAKAIQDWLQTIRSKAYIKVNA